MVETHIDWKIHRRLEEAKTVYIYPARGMGSYVLQVLHLLREGKIVAVRRGDEGWNYYFPDRDYSISF